MHDKCHDFKSEFNIPIKIGEVTVDKTKKNDIGIMERENPPAKNTRKKIKYRWAW